MSTRKYAREKVFDYLRPVNSPECSKAMQTAFKGNGMNDVKAQRKLVIKLTRNSIIWLWFISPKINFPSHYSKN